MANILIADDEELVRAFLKRVIEGMGHTVFLASNGVSALELFQQHPIDLSIVDIRMPEMDGLTFLHKAKEWKKDAVVIMVTGYPSAETITETVEEEAYTYITKPLDPNQIIALIQRGLSTPADR